MRQRVKTSIILALILIPTVLFGGWTFNLVIAAIAVLASMELLKMADIKIYSFPSIITYVGTLSIVFHEIVSVLTPADLTDSFFPIISILLILVSTVIVKNYNFTMAGISTLTMLYIGLGARAAIVLRAADLALFIFILLVVMATDIGAYFIGSKIGKNKLAPLLSPNKTIEGSIGGVLTALIIAAIYLNFFTFNYSYPMMLLISIILSITGQFGDLIESAFKRHYKVKDSGTIFPGHGGILDRFDSILFTLGMALLLGIA